MHAKQGVLRGDQYPGQEQDEQDPLGPDLEGNEEHEKVSRAWTLCKSVSI